MNEISIDVATQLNKILSFLPDDVKKNIPQDIWKKINDKTDNNLYTKIKEVRDIKEENILPETRKYLSFIFINYLATEEERKEYTKIVKNNEEQYQKILNKKYSVDNIFKKDLKQEKQEQVDIIIYKEPLWKRMINKIKSLILGHN